MQPKGRRRYERKHLRRVYISPAEWNARIIKGERVRHLSTVLRLSNGSKVIVFDGTGKEHLIEIRGVRSGEVAFTEVGEIDRGQPDADSLAGVRRALSVTLCQGLLKGRKFDLVVEKATELGVSKIVPTKTERSVPEYPEDGGKGKVLRWQSIAQQAAAQSGRVVATLISSVTSFRRATELAKSHDASFLLWEMEMDLDLQGFISSLSSPGSLCIFVGPEGGFSRGEVEYARECGIPSVSLGSLILRAETVPLAVLSVLQFELGAFGKGFPLPGENRPV